MKDSGIWSIKLFTDFDNYTIHLYHAPLPLLCMHPKGQYPLGNFGVPPIVLPITLWVWPIYWATGQPITRRQEDCRLISSMFDISPTTDRLATAVVWRSVGVFVNRLVGMGLTALGCNHYFKQSYKPENYIVFDMIINIRVD